MKKNATYIETLFAIVGVISNDSSVSNKLSAEDHDLAGLLLSPVC